MLWCFRDSYIKWFQTWRVWPLIPWHDAFLRRCILCFVSAVHWIFIYFIEQHLIQRSKYVNSDFPNNISHPLTVSNFKNFTMSRVMDYNNPTDNCYTGQCRWVVSFLMPVTWVVGVGGGGREGVISGCRVWMGGGCNSWEDGLSPKGANIERDGTGRYAAAGRDDANTPSYVRCCTLLPDYTLSHLEDHPWTSHLHIRL